MPIWSRPDADPARDVPAYRRMMPLLMTRRNDSAVLFEQRIDAGPALAFVRAWNEQHDRKISFMHLVVRAVVRTLAARPRLNRFTAGGRLWQRRGIWISYSAKKAMSDDAPLVVVKREFAPDESFEAMLDRMDSQLGDARSDKPSHVDKELKLLLSLPLFLLKLFVRLAAWADRHGLLPAAFIKNDPMFASVFVANLGSIKIDAAYHHNYEYGNIPIFVTIGRFERAPVVTDGGTLAVRDEVSLKWTYDERIEDGLYCARALELLKGWLEEPEELTR